MSGERFDKEINLLENLQIIKDDFGEEIEGYLAEKDDTTSSNRYFDIIISRAKKIDNVELFNALIEYVGSLTKSRSGDDKLQLLNLWSALENIDMKTIKDNIETRENIPFEISGYVEIKTRDIIRKIKGKSSRVKRKALIRKTDIKEDEKQAYKYNVTLDIYPYGEYNFNIIYEGGSIMSFEDSWGNVLGRIGNIKTNRKRKQGYIGDKDIDLESHRIPNRLSIIFEDGNKKAFLNIYLK